VRSGEVENKDISMTAEAEGEDASAISQNVSSQHEIRMISSSNNWEAIRDQVLSAFTGECHLPPNAICCICKGNPAVVVTMPSMWATNLHLLCLLFGSSLTLEGKLR